MKMYSTKMQSNGRVLIPAEVRKRLMLNPGDELVISELDGKITLSSKTDALKRLQKYVKKHFAGRDLVQELIDERRAEARKEMDTK
jgi:AbrB family looped-hinge helix DNA binding protein